MAATLGACYECPFCIEFDPVAAHIRTLGDQVESCALTHAWIDYGCRPCEGEKLAKFGAFALRQRVITHLQTRSTACHSFSFPSDRDGCDLNHNFAVWQRYALNDLHFPIDCVLNAYR